MTPEHEIKPFPTDPAEFGQDDRISYSQLDNKFIGVQDDGTEFEFNDKIRRWVPVLDEAEEALILAHQESYGASAQDDAQTESSQNKKRKIDDSNDREHDGNSRPKNKKQARQQTQPKQNTAIYVTGLPLDVTVDEVAELFTRKCGVIAEEIDSGRPRIKMYTDDKGNFKGDALIVFFKPQSVDMAIMLLDDTDFSYTSSGLGTGKMRIMPADASYKKSNQEGAAVAAKTNNGQEEKPKGGAKRHDDKAKIIKKTQKLSAKLADWDDDEPATANPAAKNSKWDKVVILTHMFTLKELEEDPAALLDIKEDIRDECAKLGTVTNVVLFDQEEDGIVSVRFSTVEAAEACLQLMHGRAFDGRRVEAYFATGKEKFKKSKKDGADDHDSE